MKKNTLKTMSISILCAGMLVGCGGGESENNGGGASDNNLLNETPIAKITSITEKNGVVYLDASGSYDVDGVIKEYKWSIDGKGGFSVKTPVAKVGNLSLGKHTFSLTVYDDEVFDHTDAITDFTVETVKTVDIAPDTVEPTPPDTVEPTPPDTVEPTPPDPNIAPISKPIVLGTAYFDPDLKSEIISYSVSGDDSYDSDGNIVSYIWTEDSSGIEYIGSITKVSVAFSVGEKDWVSTFTLKVSDNDGANGDAILTLPYPTANYRPKINVDEVANTFVSRTPQKVLLNASSTTDDGVIEPLTFSWVEVDSEGNTITNNTFPMDETSSAVASVTIDDSSGFCATTGDVSLFYKVTVNDGKYTVSDIITFDAYCGR